MVKRSLICLFASFSFSLSAQAVDPTLLDGLKARLVGPAAMSGRVAAIDAEPGDAGTILVGAASGGIWKSADGGLTWTPTFDDQPVHSIGAVAIHPAHPDIVWVGTGEGNTRNSTSVGAGIFKSLDGGETWQRMGLEKTERIHRIAVHPTDPDIAYVAALGELWGENADRGVYKTEDGGKTWQKILYVDRKTGATDIQMDPSNPNKLFAAMWQFRRWPMYFKSGGPGSGLYVSHDAGDSWTELTPEDGLPEGELGRASFAIAPSDPKRVYALVEAKTSALLRSDDGGRHWQSVNTDPDINDRPFYYGDIRVDPADKNRVYRVGSRVKLSIDGGKSFDYLPAIDCCATSNTVHIDTHAFWIDPQDPEHIIVGNDGGIAISRDHGMTWRYVRNLPLAQFYHIAVDNADPYHIYGGLQDNGSWRGPSEVRDVGGIRNFHWREVAFGDGFDTLPDPQIADQGYAMSQGGNLYRWNLQTGEMRLIRPQPPEPDVELRFNWNAGLAQDPFDPATIYYGSQFVHKSTDRGASWSTISGDLTSDDPDKQTYKESGGLTSDVTAAENHTTIVAIAPSPVKKGVIWVGTDDGRVHVTQDGGKSWTSLEERFSGMPDGAQVPMIEPSPHGAGTAFIAVDGHRMGDMGTYLYRAEGYGQKVRRIARDSAVDGYVHSVRQDIEDPDLLFVGTERGLYVSLDGGSDWAKWTAGVPTASVRDIAIQARETDLVLGTHGRAAFVIDDYRALRGLSDSDFTERLKLLTLTDAQQYDPNQPPSMRFSGSAEFRADNEPYGVMITFVASGEDLPHPDEAQERARKAAQREAKAKETETDADLTSQEAEAEEAGTEEDRADAASQGQAEDTPEDMSEDKGPEDKSPEDKGKVTVEVANSAAQVIRIFKADVQQGINRIVWDMRRDGIDPAPPAKPREDGTKPAGIEVLPGSYTITLRFDGIEQSGQAQVTADPAWTMDAEAMQASHATLLRLQGLQGAMNAALRRIHDARRDVTTLMTLIGEAEDAAEGERAQTLADLKTQAEELKSALDEAEATFRVPQGTRGIVYTGDKVSSKLGQAVFYVASTKDAPSQAARAYVARADQAVREGVGRVNTLIEEDLAALRRAYADSGIDLLAQEQVPLP
ncbi:MAG: hypothetical protein ACFB22_04155 [Rhodothalassiaceae bacterium]